MRSRGNTGSQERNANRSKTYKQKRNGRHRPNQLFVVGIGPGSLDYLSKRAVDALSSAEIVVGYSTYVDLIHPLVDGKEIMRTGMTKEVERVEAAINQALGGKSCAIVSSGDPGIYAMAGLVFEICKIKGIAIVPRGSKNTAPDDTPALQIEVVPGIPALCAGASLLGAPLTHDFAAISLSDLLTPWELIEQRIQAAAEADFVIVLYNPKSKKRSWQLEKAQKILLDYRDKNTPVGIVARAMREQQRVQIVALENLHTADVDMQTTVFVGSRSSSRYKDFMVTPRGYSKKYDIYS